MIHNYKQYKNQFVQQVKNNDGEVARVKRTMMMKWLVKVKNNDGEEAREKRTMTMTLLVKVKNNNCDVACKKDDSEVIDDKWKTQTAKSLAKSGKHWW